MSESQAIIPIQHIIDNESTTVAEHLRRRLSDAEAFDFVSAYFTIYGYELLADELDALDRVRFLFGDPTSVEDIDPGAKETKFFNITEQGLKPSHTLQQKHLAQRCKTWVKSDAVSIRSVSLSNFLHGKMYLSGGGSATRSGIVGSSNFTKGGLGESRRSNLEINLATTDADTLTELQGWFDRLWGDETRTEDVKQQVIEALERVGRDHSPEDVYYKTLYELFRKEIEARAAGDDGISATDLHDKQIWKELYDFQRDGAKSIIARLREHNGCILADSVGLGKTYTALAVIKYFELHNRQVLVLCPSKLLDNWRLYPANFGHVQNPFIKDSFGYTLLAHTDLSRESGTTRTGIDLANFNWSSYGLVVIDESHNFRNSDGKRYRKLLDEIISEGAQTKVLMLSATPVNTSLLDLRNQIYLMTDGRENSFAQSLGVRDINSVMKNAQAEFKQWEEAQRGNARRDKEELLGRLGADFLRLLSGVSIARSRRQVQRFYADEMERIGKFPTREKPVNHYPDTDLRGELSYEELSEHIGRFQLRQYRPSEYLKGADRLEQLPFDDLTTKDAQQNREYYLVGMMRTNFLKRLESSAHSLTLTLERTIGKIDDLLGKFRHYELDGDDDSLDNYTSPVEGEDDADDEDLFIGKGKRPYRLSEMDIPRWRADLIEDKKVLAGVYQRIAAIDTDRDGKLRQIKADIAERAANPTRDQEGRQNRKLLVFTTFKDTAMYLYDNLKEQTERLELNMAMVSGDETRATFGRNDFNAILSNFAPVARNRARDGDSSRDGEIDLLIATDCISEGQNLQDCDTVLNYDIHWNPVRLVQRFGRIDRIGSKYDSVRMINYWPTSDMDAYLKLQNRVYARMAIADVSASGDDNLLDTDTMKREAEQERRFRDEQTRRIIEEVADMDDLTDTPVMSDFTLDHFLTQLLRYLERNREKLEEMPPGIYAVTDGAPSPGAIFFLRQRNAADEQGQRLASPMHPLYFVYVRDRGSIRYGCGSAHRILSAFEAAASGKMEAITRLCDAFDSETDNGRDMSKYNRLLSAAIDSIRQDFDETLVSGLGINGAGGDLKLPLESETPRNEEDFELVTWLVIKERA